MGRLRDNGITGRETGPTDTSRRGFPFVPDEGLVCPPRHPRLSPTRPSFVPHGNLVGDTGDADARFVKIFINPKDINQADMKRTLLTLTLLLALAAGHAQEPLALSRQACRDMALRHSEDLRRADNAVRQAELDKQIAFAAYLPQLDATGTGAYVGDLDMMGMQLQMRGMYMAGIALTQPIYAGGRIRTGNRLAKIGRESRQENRRMTRMQVIADADQAYWSYIAVTWKVRMLEAYKAQMDTLFAQAENSLAAGMATGNDLLRIRTRRSDIHYQWQKARNGANLCRLALCNVLGCPLETQITPTDTTINVPPAGRLDTDISLRPEARLLHKQVEAAEQQVKMARADLLPTVGLSAGYMYYGNVRLKGMTQDAQGNALPFTQKFSDGLPVVMASVSIPLFRWGSGLKQIKKAKLDVENARLDLQKNTRLLRIEATQAAQNLEDSRLLIETARSGAREADDNLRIQHDRYLNGMATLTDLLNAQAQWQQAQSNLIDAQTQHKMYETEYLRVTGRLE